MKLLHIAKIVTSPLIKLLTFKSGETGGDGRAAVCVVVSLFYGSHPLEALLTHRSRQYTWPALPTADPREFASLVLVSVCIPPQAWATAAPVPRAALGLSHHRRVHLIPTYRQMSILQTWGPDGETVEGESEAELQGASTLLSGRLLKPETFMSSLWHRTSAL